jgi:uncharacterized membrane protein YccC
MAGSCPLCGARIRSTQILSKFACVGCGAWLRAKTFSPMLVVLAVWAVCDFIVMLFLGELFVTGWPKVARVGLSFAIGAAVYWAVFSSVKIRAETKSKNDAS